MTAETIKRISRVGKADTFPSTIADVVCVSCGRIESIDGDCYVCNPLPACPSGCGHAAHKYLCQEEIDCRCFVRPNQSEGSDDGITRGYTCTDALFGVSSDALEANAMGKLRLAVLSVIAGIEHASESLPPVEAARYYLMANQLQDAISPFVGAPRS